MAQTIQLYQQLLEMPLFQGMSHNDLEEVVAHTRFGFLKYRSNKTVVDEGQACTHLLFLLKGSLQTKRFADDRSYSLSEQLDAPELLQPERIFGLTQRYTYTFTTLCECNFIRIDKSEALRLTESYEIFRLNLLNIVTTQSQKLSHLPWRSRPHDTRQKIIRFIANHCMRPVGPKRLDIRMEVMAREVDESRLHVSQQLNAMQQEGLLSFSRGVINIPAFEKLLSSPL